MCTGNILRDDEYLWHYLQLFNKPDFILLSNPTKTAGYASQLLSVATPPLSRALSLALSFHCPFCCI